METTTTQEALMHTTTATYLEVLTRAGYIASVVPTGGNCTAILVEKPGRADLHVLVTDDAQAPDDIHYCTVGGYWTANSDPLETYIDTDLVGIVDAVDSLFDMRDLIA